MSARLEVHAIDHISDEELVVNLRLALNAAQADGGTRAFTMAREPGVFITSSGEEQAQVLARPPAQAQFVFDSQQSARLVVDKLGSSPVDLEHFFRTCRPRSQPLTVDHTRSEIRSRVTVLTCHSVAVLPTCPFCRLSLLLQRCWSRCSCATATWCAVRCRA